MPQASLPTDSYSTDSPSDNIKSSSDNSPDLSSKEFSTDNPSLPTTPIPAAAPIVQHNIPQAASSSSSGSSSGGSSGGSGIPFGAIGSIAGTVVGGPIGGAIGGALGSLFGSLAEGGQPKDPVSLTLGYLTGALHQQKYGGTPDTLHQAAEEVKHHLSKMPQQQPQGLAAGGSTDSSYGDTATTDPYTGSLTNSLTNGSAADNKSVDQMILMRSLGLLPTSSTGSEDQSGNQQQSTQSSNTANAMTSGAIPGQQAAAAPASAPIKKSNGYLNEATGYAEGGPEQPPLQPGQQFQGDGSVKGPGGPTDDEIPARLSNGEFVMSAATTQFFGVDKLSKMNEQGKAGFAQATQAVQQNQPGGQPQQPPSMGRMQRPQMAPQQPQEQPMQQAKGGPTISMRRNSGFMGL